MSDIRLLGPGDLPALDAFLATATASTMMMRSNLRLAGVVDGPNASQGAYAAKVENGNIVAAAAHYWNNNIVFFAKGCATELAEFLAAATQRPIMGLIGPWADCLDAVAGLNVGHRTIDRPPHSEILYELNLANLVVPKDLVAGKIGYRRATADDLPTLISWRVNYELETLRYEPSPEVNVRAQNLISQLVGSRDLWVATCAGVPFCMSAFNARLPDTVQVGGVHTPQEHRGKGYARAAVAGSLVDARNEGAVRGILFTEITNTPAQHVYEALGFKRIGDYGMVLLHPEK